MFNGARTLTITPLPFVQDGTRGDSVPFHKTGPSAGRACFSKKNSEKQHRVRVLMRRYLTEYDMCPCMLRHLLADMVVFYADFSRA